MKTLADRFRQWYEFERDCTVKSQAMLQSVPAEKRSDPLFQKAIDKFAHIDAARLRWLHRLGHWPELVPGFPPGLKLEELPTRFAATETAWLGFFAKLDDAILASEFEWIAPDSKRYRWTVEGALTTLMGHANYHRGQIVTYVHLLGGKPVDTDYFYWLKLTPLEG